MEPDVQALRVGDPAIVGLPTVHVRIMGIRRFDPPFEMGWLPHTELALGVCLLGDEDDPEAGFSLYLPAAEPIVIRTFPMIRALPGTWRYRPRDS